MFFVFVIFVFVSFVFTTTNTAAVHPFNSLFSVTTWVSQYKKGKASLDLNEARDDRVLEWHWHQLDHNM